MKISQLFRAALAALVAAFAGPSVWAHVSYSGRDFGTFTVSGAEPPKVITIGNVSSAFGWAAATDADFGDSHRTRAFRVTLTNPAVVTLRVQGVVVGAAPALPYPGFSIYQGLCHVAPKQSDHDSSEISALYLASLGGVQPKAGALIALGNFKIGDDPTYNVSGDPNSGILYPAELVTLDYMGHAADGTSANYGTAPGIQGDGTGDNDVQKSFVLPAGDYSIFIGGGDYSAISNGPTWPNYGITATFSVATLTAAPTVNVPANITTTATSGAGAVVSFSVSGTDAAGNTIAATPGTVSGSTFPLGTTTVNVSTTDAAGQTSNSSFTVTVNPSTDATLASLSVTGATLSPAFDPNTTNYTATVGNATITATVTAATTFAAATTGQTPANPVALTAGSNAVTVHVTAQDGSTTKDYMVNVKRTMVDTMKPAIAITTPGSSVAGTFTASGTAKELVGLASLSVSLNGGLAQAATLPTDVGAAIPWNVSGLVPENGTNTLVVHAVDYNGNTATTTKSFTFLNSRPNLAGSYVVLLNPDGTPDNDTAALLDVTVTPTGTFTGKATISGTKIGFSGLLNNAGQARFKGASSTSMALLDRGELFTNLGWLSFAVSNTGLSGSLSTAGTGGTTLAHGTGKVSTYSTGNLVPANFLNQPTAGPTKGVYNVVFPAKEQAWTTDRSLYPQGTGYVMLTLTNKGMVSAAGLLADGSKFGAASRLRSDGTVPLFAMLYKKLGFASGELTLASLTDSDATGTDLLWFRPANARAAYFPGGWTTLRVDALGTKYLKPDSLNFGQGSANLLDGNAKLVFTDGLLSGGIDKTVSVDPTGGAAKKVPANDASFTLGLSSGTGIFTGTFLHSDTTKPFYKGVLLNKGATQRGFGFFLSAPPSGYGESGQSGAVSLYPGVK